MKKIVLMFVSIMTLPSTVFAGVDHCANRDCGLITGISSFTTHFSFTLEKSHNCLNSDGKHYVTVKKEKLNDPAGFNILYTQVISAFHSKTPITRLWSGLGDCSDIQMINVGDF